jgi:hypothetical protein
MDDNGQIGVYTIVVCGLASGHVGGHGQSGGEVWRRQQLGVDETSGETRTLVECQRSKSLQEHCSNVASTLAAG